MGIWQCLVLSGNVSLNPGPDSKSLQVVFLISDQLGTSLVLFGDFVNTKRLT